MSRPKIKWDYAKYRAALKGDSEVPGLRSLIKGFEPEDRYNLSDFKSWTPGMRRRIRDYYDRVSALEAQERLIVRPRSPKNLDRLHGAFHGNIPSKKFKVAFVPYTTPTPLPGGKRTRPKIKYHKDGITLDVGPYSRNFAAFNKHALATDPRAEIQRVTGLMPDAKLMFVQCGEYQTLNGRDEVTIQNQILKFMEKYDGVTQFKRGSGKYGDDPAAHAWYRWLNGVVGYSYTRKISMMTMHRTILAGMAEAKKRAALRRRKFSKLK
jgi:hypothetical protein